MPYGIIKIGVTDLRAGPDSTEERLSQALFGTAVEFRNTRKGFARITLPDGYKGWCRVKHIELVSPSRWRFYKKQRKYMIKAESVSVRGPVYGQTDRLRLYFGTELIVTQTGGIFRLEMPGGEKIKIRGGALRPPLGKKKPQVEGKDILKAARLFLGAPYLWGGITGAGIDCSGLVQMVYRYHGIELARDSREQREDGIAIDRSELRAGDLLFFPGHVAISCGGDVFIHAAASRGITLIESLNPAAPNYRSDLDKSYEMSRRILK